MKPVDEQAGAEIDAWLSATLASIPRDPVTGHGRGASRPINALLNQVQHAYGWPGIYRVALACARISTAGLMPQASDDQRGRHPYQHFGEVGEIGPETPAGYRVSRFVVALMSGLEADAWLEFIRWQPDESSEPSDAMREALASLLERAWNRQAGNELTWTINPGTRWPPECDFCCSGTARWMFRCKPFTMAGAVDPSGGMGGIKIEYSDSDRWYACGQCAVFIEADDYTALWRRYASTGREAGTPTEERGEANVRGTWQKFRRTRRPKRYPLPKTRPEPST